MPDICLYLAVYITANIFFFLMKLKTTFVLHTHPERNLQNVVTTSDREEG